MLQQGTSHCCRPSAWHYAWRAVQTSDFASLPSPRPFLTYEPQPRFAEPKAVAVSMDGEFLELTRPPMTGELQVHGLHGDDEAPASDLAVEQC